MRRPGHCCRDLSLTFLLPPPNFCASPDVSRAVGRGSAAFGEELLARGFILDRIAKVVGSSGISATISAVVLQAVLFGAFHAHQGTGGMLVTAVAGLIMGVTWLGSGRNLWDSIVCCTASSISSMRTSRNAVRFGSYTPRVRLAPGEHGDRWAAFGPISIRRDLAQEGSNSLATATRQYPEISWKRQVLALTTAFVLTLLVDIILNAIVFRRVFVNAAQHLLPASELNRRVPLGWLAMLAIMLGYVLLYSRLADRLSGLKFGFIIAALGAAGVVGIASLVPWPVDLLSVMALQQAVNGILLGLVLAFFWRRSLRSASAA